MSGVKHHWSSMGVLPDVSRWAAVNRVMKGLKRCTIRMPNRKHTISPDDLMFFRSRMDLDSPFPAALLLDTRLVLFFVGHQAWLQTSKRACTQTCETTQNLQEHHTLAEQVNE